jgi:hypothetical protein
MEKNIVLIAEKKTQSEKDKNSFKESSVINPRLISVFIVCGALPKRLAISLLNLSSSFHCSIKRRSAIVKCFPFEVFLHIL